MCYPGFDPKIPRYPGDYVSPAEIHYNIHRENTRHDHIPTTYGLWMWSNHESGWGWKGSFATAEEAFEVMKSGDPSKDWNPTFVAI